MWLCVKSTHLHPFAVFEQILSDENKEVFN